MGPKSDMAEIRFSNYDLIDLDKDIEVDMNYNPTQLYLLISDSKWYEALRSMKDNPIQARIWVVKTEHFDSEESTCRFLPIHSACARQAPLSVVAALLEAYPEGASREDENGMCPLHYACANHASSEVVQILLEFFPEGRLQRAEVSRALPIHLAAQWGVSSPKVFRHLLEGNDSLASARDSEGLSPIDLVVEADYPRRYEILSILKESMLQETLENSSTISSSGPLFEHQEIIDLGNDVSAEQQRPREMSKSSENEEENLFTKTAEILRNEVIKLQNKKSFVRSSVNDQMALEWQAVHIAIGEMDQKVETMLQEKGSSGRREHSPVSNNTRRVENKSSDENRNDELETLQSENKIIENELDNLKDQYKSYHRKIEKVEDIIKHLADTMTHVVTAHKEAMTRIQNMEKDMLQVTKLRSDKLKELTQDVETMATQMSSFSASKTQQKTYDVLQKEGEILDKMSAIIKTLKS